MGTRTAARLSPPTGSTRAAVSRATSPHAESRTSRSTTSTRLLLRLPEPYDFDVSTERFRVFGADVANLWHEGGLHRVVDGREVRIEAAPGGVDVAPLDDRTRPVVEKLLGLEFDLPRFYAWAADRPVLAALGFSRRKAEYVVGLAREEIDLEALAMLDDDEVRARLTAIRGLGPWTADWFLARHLARPRAWPAGDLGVRKAAQLLYGLDVHELGRRLDPFQNLSAHYLLTGMRVA